MTACGRDALEGRPLPILTQQQRSGRFELDEEALASVLMAPEVRDKRVCVLSVAGAFRKGKSFLLDFFLRYCQSENKENWLGDFSQPLRGFNWRYGRRGETAGILMWSKPFIVTDTSGQQVAVILVDTQGTFDTEATLKDSVVVFTLALLLSSVLVYNLMNNIQEDDLMNLQTFTSFGMLAQERGGTFEPFQKLLFLVRDWNFPGELPYGREGGQAVLDEVLMTNEGQQPANRKVREDIHHCFSIIESFLMAHPGNSVRRPDFDGSVQGLDEEFRQLLQILVPQLLGPDNLVLKKISGRSVTAGELCNFFSSVARDVQEAGNIEPTTLVEANAKAGSQVALELATKHYTDAMDLRFGASPEASNSTDDSQKTFFELAELRELHAEDKRRAVDYYLTENRYGQMSPAVLQNFQRKLEQEIERKFASYVQMNDINKQLDEVRKNAALEQKRIEEWYKAKVEEEAYKIHRKRKPWWDIF